MSDTKQPVQSQKKASCLKFKMIVISVKRKALLG